VEVTDIEDVREAKRREVVERAKELLSESFDESVLSSSEILDEVKESVRIEDISEYEGLPAGPRVGESDAVVVVEGRADVLTLLRYGIKNAVGVEGTNVPDAVADLTQDRTTTAFLDGDRGGRLILRELTQVGDVDHVAFAPEGRSVEDLERHEVFGALRNKDPIDAVETDPSAPADAADDTEGEPPDPPTGSPTTESAAPRTGTLDAQEYEYDARDGSRGAHPGAVDPNPPVAGDAEETEPSADTTPAADDDPDGGVPVSNGVDGTAVPEGSDTPCATAAAEPETVDNAPGKPAPDVGDDASEDATAPDSGRVGDEEGADAGDEVVDSDDAGDEVDDSNSEASDEVEDTDDAEADDDAPRSLAEHVREVVDDGRGTIRLLDGDLATITEASDDDAFDAIADADPAPYAAVFDGEFTQRLLDIAAQRGVDHIVAAATGEFVKKPVGVRLRTADQLAVAN
jgi:DNA primase